MNIIELNKKAWDALAADTAWPYRKHEKYLQVLNAFCSALNTGATVLDIGCGPGVPITRLLVDRGFQVTGIDFSEKMLARAADNVSEADFACLSVTDMEFESVFDGVVASFSLIGLDEPGFSQAAVRMIAALKPRGYCFIALNETVDQNNNAEGISNVEMSEVGMIGAEQKVKLYGRTYAEAQLRDAFSALSFIMVEREIISSERYGKENTILLLLRKEA